MSKLKLFPIVGFISFIVMVIVLTHFKFRERGYFSEQQQQQKQQKTSDPDEFGHIYRDYIRYVRNIDSRCRTKQKFGGKDDSGYDVCTDVIYTPGRPCLAYSFGSRFVFGFENDVIKKFGCETHTFDPSWSIAGHDIPKGIDFHLIGLSDRDYINDLGWPMQSLSSLRNSLNHTSTLIDLLKIDIEGYEWKAIPHMLSTVPLKYIKQLLIEIHFGREKKGMSRDGYITLKSNFWGNVDIFSQFNVLKQLYDNGFRVFSYSENPRSRIRSFDSSSSGIITCHVVSMININFDT